MLGELAGADALREVALDRELERELRSRGISLEDADIDAERERLAKTLGLGELGDELTRQILAARSIGPHRLGALLARNAGLRKLIEPPEPPSEEAVRVAYDVRYGLQRRVRVAVFASSREAARARTDIARAAETAGITAAFAEIAAERSTDRSAPLGGLIGEISVADPGLPAVLRRAVASQAAGALGDIVALDQGFALMLVEREIPARETPIETVESELRSEIAERATRLAMETLAEELIRRASITPLDPALRWSWDRAQRAGPAQPR